MIKPLESHISTHPVDGYVTSSAPTHAEIVKKINEVVEFCNRQESDHSHEALSSNNGLEVSEEPMPKEQPNE